MKHRDSLLRTLGLLAIILFLPLNNYVQADEIYQPERLFISYENTELVDGFWLYRTGSKYGSYLSVKDVDKNQGIFVQMQDLYNKVISTGVYEIIPSTSNCLNLFGIRESVLEVIIFNNGIDPQKQCLEEISFKQISTDPEQINQLKADFVLEQMVVREKFAQYRMFEMWAHAILVGSAILWPWIMIWLSRIKHHKRFFALVMIAQLVLITYYFFFNANFYISDPGLFDRVMSTFVHSTFIAVVIEVLYLIYSSVKDRIRKNI